MSLQQKILMELSNDRGEGPTKGHGNGLTWLGRWKRIRSGQRMNYKRVKGRRISQERAGTSHHIALRTAINTRYGLYKHLNPTGKGKKTGLSNIQRSQVERVEKRLARLYVGAPASRNNWKTRRKDTFRGRLTGHAKV